MAISGFEPASQFLLISPMRRLGTSKEWFSNDLNSLRPMTKCLTIVKKYHHLNIGCFERYPQVPN